MKFDLFLQVNHLHYKGLYNLPFSQEIHHLHVYIYSTQLSTSVQYSQSTMKYSSQVCKQVDLHLYVGSR